MNCFVEFLHWSILVTRRACTRAWTFIATELLPTKKHPERIVRSLRIAHDHPKVGLQGDNSHVEDNNSLLENVFQVCTASHPQVCSKTYQSVFQFFDKDGSGKISRGEIRNGLRDLGNNPDEREVEKLLFKVICLY